MQSGNPKQNTIPREIRNHITQFLWVSAWNRTDFSNSHRNHHHHNNAKMLPVLMLYIITTAAMPSPGLDVIRFSRLDEKARFGDLDCDSPDAPAFCRYAFARRSSEQCAYLVTMRSVLQSEEEYTFCAQPRKPVPCAIYGPNADRRSTACVVPPMEISQFDLMIMYIVNQELKARIIQLLNQKNKGEQLDPVLQQEVAAILSDNLDWLCSRKCSNESCDFLAHLDYNEKSRGGIPSMPTLVSDLSSDGVKSTLARIEIPVGTPELSALLNKKLTFGSVEAPDLLSVTCKKNSHFFPV
ncbi:hypothetical protein SprV_0602115300 [Sparganum proliferum]